MLAFAGICSSDLAVSLALLIAVWACWKLFHRVSPWRILASSLCLAAAFLVKYSAFLLIPVYALLLALRVLTRRSLPVMGFGKLVRIPGRRRGRIFLVLAGAAVVNSLLIWLCIWGAYGFRYSMVNSPELNSGIPRAYWHIADRSKSSATDTLKLVNDCRLLPEAYLCGLGLMLNNVAGRQAFLNGQYSESGWWYFFPYCFLVKNPLVLLMLLALLLIAAVWCSIRMISETSPGKFWRKFYPVTPLLTLLIVYFGVAMASSLNIGVRHILPCWPPLLILAGFAGRFFRPGAGKVMRWLTLLLLAGYAAVGLNAWPDYLAYFNLLAGGKSQGYRHLVDSSLDWGQDLPGLRKWLRKHQKGQPVYLAYFGSALPEYYLPDAHLLPCFLPRGKIDIAPLKGGIYAISATMLQLTFLPNLAQWDEQDEQMYRRLEAAMKSSAASNPEYLRKLGRKLAYYRFGKLAAYLRKREPDTNIGGSILIFRLTDAELKKALQ